ncbi:serine kinase [Corynebacterium sphenisci DSM 44792]|uniref:Phosphocarrier protein HPr n=1 Tax=Corynebacterium sphenisci DSM 44792 TaxID=1437874 RepID=A0A1L7CXN1_9CORY|nr:HPr family phosphocarrier protein [Corynebacterium sphenisci]APT90616.1 serine kinase [Corynebacterium sphenisci DSM 44792]
MASTTVTVGSTVGLHARPATVISEAAAEYDDEILIELVDADDDDAEPADAASSLMIMSLGAEHGDQVTISSDNADAVAAIAALVEKNLDEE